MDKIEAIIDSYTNGNRKDMVSQIDEYGHYDFWSDLDSILDDFAHQGIMSFELANESFIGICITYNKIKHR